MVNKGYFNHKTLEGLHKDIARGLSQEEIQGKIAAKFESDMAWLAKALLRHNEKKGGQ